MCESVDIPRVDHVPGDRLHAKFTALWTLRGQGWRGGGQRRGRTPCSPGTGRARACCSEEGLPEAAARRDT